MDGKGDLLTGVRMAKPKVSKRNAMLISATLREVNKLRKIMRLKPLRAMPLGVVQDSDFCPIAMALGNDEKVAVDNDSIEFKEHPKVKSDKMVRRMADIIGVRVSSHDDFVLVIKPKHPLSRFVVAFDRHQLPHLEKAKDNHDVRSIGGLI